MQDVPFSEGWVKRALFGACSDPRVVTRINCPMLQPYEPLINHFGLLEERGGLRHRQHAGGTHCTIGDILHVPRSEGGEPEELKGRKEDRRALSVCCRPLGKSSKA